MAHQKELEELVQELEKSGDSTSATKIRTQEKRQNYIPWFKKHIKWLYLLPLIIGLTLYPPWFDFTTENGTDIPTKMHIPYALIYSFLISITLFFINWLFQKSRWWLQKYTIGS